MSTRKHKQKKHNATKKVRQKEKKKPKGHHGRKKHKSHDKKEKEKEKDKQNIYQIHAKDMPGYQKKKTVLDKFKDLFALKQHSREARVHKTEKKLHSYSPTINKQLVTLKSAKRTEIGDCNNEAAFALKEPLKIKVPGYIYGNYCVPYTETFAQKFLLKRLAANKHVDSSKVIPPKQIDSNCWFNAMFVNFFVSDKGRKFFHFFRELMIQGVQKNGRKVEPNTLKDAFGLLNFGIESALTGSKYAYTMNTNAIIQRIFESIPHTSKQIKNVRESGNPLLYYMAILRYLNNQSISILYLNHASSNWRQEMDQRLSASSSLPHIIVIEILSENANQINNRPTTINIKGAEYALDSAVVRDTTKRHFSTTFTLEKKEMAYDGYSYHRLKDMLWKYRLNQNSDWSFEGSNLQNGQPLLYNFMKSYQMLFYYRVK